MDRSVWGKLASVPARLTPGIIGGVCVMPYAVIYLRNLWGISHYQFFPLLLAAVGYLVYSRWSSDDGGRASRIFSIATIVLGFVIAAGATLFASAWMAYFAFVCFVASVLARVRDRDDTATRTSSLAYLAIPLLLIWQPPYSPNATGDGVLIARLQNVSAAFSSKTLDLLGVLHDCPGTVIRCAGKSFGVEEACSGVQSFFSLLCFAALVFAFYRRGLLHGLLLAGASVFWAVVMNTLRITLIPLAYITLGLDLAHGLLHTLVGLSTMFLGVVLLLSTDRLLVAIAPVKTVEEWLVGLINVGSQPASSASPEKLRVVSRPLYGVASAILFAMLLLQLYDVGSSWGEQKSKIDFFTGNELVDLFERDGPEKLKGWNKAGYSHEDRVRGADFGERSDLWYYRADVGTVMLSLDQAFPGWHELTVCYGNVGWQLTKRQVLDLEAWPVVVAEFSKGSGEQGVLVYCMFDQAGEPVDAPASWDSWNSLRERVKNRLSPNVRGTLFSLAAYQVQLFVSSPSGLSEEVAGELLGGLEEAREVMRQAVLDAR